MNSVRNASFRLKAISTAGITGLAGLGWYIRSRSIQTRSHVMIHMDVNKTMIMSDAIQDLGFKKSLNTILADSSCYGKVTNEIWEPVMIETDAQKATQHASAPLITYGDFVRKQLPYVQHSVDPQIKRKRKKLREEFTNNGNPGQTYANVVETLFNKLNDKHIIPAFFNLIDYLQNKYTNNKNESFSIIFRTFGMDLPGIVAEFNEYCKQKGYDKLCVDLTDPLTHGVMLHHHNELYLMVGTFEIDRKYERITKTMSLDTLNKADRLSFYANNEKVKFILKGYEDIYEFIRKQSFEKKKTMAIRDDYLYWALNGEKSECGKTMVMNSKDTKIHQIFFDDCASYLINARDVNNVSQHMAFDQIDGIHAVHCNPYEIMTNDNFFIDYLQKANYAFKTL